MSVCLGITWRCKLGVVKLDIMVMPLALLLLDGNRGRRAFEFATLVFILTFWASFAELKGFGVMSLIMRTTSRATFLASDDLFELIKEIHVKKIGKNRKRKFEKAHIFFGFIHRCAHQPYLIIFCASKFEI